MMMVVDSHVQRQGWKTLVAYFTENIGEDPDHIYLCMTTPVPAFFLHVPRPKHVVSFRTKPPNQGHHGVGPGIHRQ